MTKRKGAPSPPNNVLEVKTQDGEASNAMLARTVLRPSVRAAVTAQAYSRQFGNLELTALVDELTAQNSAACRGELSRAEAMLMSQASTLEAIFHELARRAALNMREYIGAAETYLRLGLKAQSQCRATLETLAAIKNPSPVTFVKQANVAHGPQQVNNGTTPASEPSRARESEIQPNKLLEQQHGDRLDTGASRTAISADSSLEAVEARDRTTDGCGEKQGF
jgi:hypothetical protein